MRTSLPLLTTSATRVFRSCQRQFWLEYEQGFRPVYVDPNRRFGTLSHRGLEEWWLARMAAPSDPDAWIRNALAALEAWEAEERDPDPFELARARVLLAGYHARWASEEGEVLAVEREFVVPLVNPATGAASRTWQFAGKVDAIVRLPSGEVWAVEHKTSSEDFGPGSDYRIRLQLDPQVSNYIAGARATGIDVRGVIYDVIGKPSLRPRLATPLEVRRYRKKDGALDARQRDRDESVEEYEERVAEAVASDPDSFFQRFPVVRLQAEEQEAAFDLWQAGVQIRESRAAAAWPRNPDACKRYGRTCQFLPVCVGQQDVRDPTRFRVVESVNEELVGVAGAALGGTGTRSTSREGEAA